MDRLAHELQLVLRSLRRSPTFSITTVAILGIGIGMAAAMYSVIDGVLLRPLPVRSPNRIVVPHARDRDGVDLSLGGDDFEDLRRSTRLLQNMAGVYHAGAFVMPLNFEGNPVVLNQAIVTGNFFQLLGVRPTLGRLLRPEDDAMGSSQAVVLSHSTWLRHFGGDAAVLGKHLRSPYEVPPYTYGFTIVGVAPAGLDFPLGVDFWSNAGSGMHNSWAMDAVARLAPGASVEAGRSEFLATMQRIGKRQEVSYDVETADIRTLPDTIFGDARPVLLVVGAAVVFLLVMSGANVAGLLLVRGAVRSPELVVRRAIGGTSGDLARLLALESTVLIVVGGTVGLGLSHVLRQVLFAYAANDLPRIDMVRLGGVPAGPVIFLAGVGAVLFAVLSWFIANRWAASPRISLDGRSGSRTQQRRRVGHMLVGAQAALALIMMVGAALLVRTMYELQHVHLGYRADRLSILTVAFPAVTQYDSLQKRVPLVDAVSTRVRAVPGVTGLTPIIAPAFAGAQVWTSPWEAEGESTGLAHGPDIPTEGGGSDYFSTFGIPIVKGRGFEPTDRLDSPPVAVVSAAVAQRFWPGADAVGKRIRMGSSDRWRTVVGVAGNAHFRALRVATPTVYVPWQQFGWQGYIAIRTTVPVSTVVPAIRRVLHEIDPAVTLWRVQPMNDAIDEQLAQPKLTTLLMTGFGSVALLLAAVGLYGVMTSTVREQTREIGVRMALGATPGRMRRQVLGHATAVVSVGILVGLLGALALSGLARSLLFRVSPADPVSLAAACGVLLGIALLAAYIPARSASLIDPARALQAD